jgi:hypothetical protein
MVAGAEPPGIPGLHSWPAFFACNGALIEYAEHRDYWLRFSRHVR